MPIDSVYFKVYIRTRLHVHTDRSFQTALIDEARHRHANEFAAALASLHLLKARMAVDDTLVNEAIGRLENAVRLERHLLDCGTPELYPAIVRLCTLLRLTRPGSPRFRLHFRKFPKIPDQASMRSVLLIAYELLTNAIKHAMTQTSVIGVRMTIRDSEIRLSVSNATGDRPSDHGSRGSGMEIVQSISSHLGGHVRYRIAGHRMIATASLPFVLRSRGDRRDAAGTSV